MLSPDDIIPDPYNVLDWDRYSYARNNPIKFNDPSGHAVQDPNDGGAFIVDSYDEEYLHYWRKNIKTPTIPEPTLLKSSTWSPIHKSSTSMNPGNSEYPGTDITPLDEFLGVLRYYKTGSDIVEIVNGISNIGVPLWRQWKGSLPGGPLVEGIIGAGTQFSKDVTDNSRIRSWREIAIRSVVAGGEDALTESISSPTGAWLGAAGGAAGAASGPAAPVLGPVGVVAGYFIGANATTWFMDNIFWEPINRKFEFYR